MADDMKYGLPPGYLETEQITSKTGRMAVILHVQDRRWLSWITRQAYRHQVFKVANIEIEVTEWGQDAGELAKEAEEHRQSIVIEEQWLRRFGFYEGVPRIWPLSSLPLWLAWLWSYLTSWIPARWLPAWLQIKYVGELGGWGEGAKRANYIALERLERLAKKDNRSERIRYALLVAYYIARTLTYIHAQGCVQRDVKSYNIMVRVQPRSAFGRKLEQWLRTLLPGWLMEWVIWLCGWAKQRPVLIDFNISVAVGAQVLGRGTLRWMDPKIRWYRDRGILMPAQCNSDVYGLAVSLCHLITLVPPEQPASDDYSYTIHTRLRKDAFAELDAEFQDADEATRQIICDLKAIITSAMGADEAERPGTALFSAKMAKVYRQVASSASLGEATMLWVTEKTRGRVEYQIHRWPLMGTVSLATACAVIWLSLTLSSFIPWRYTPPAAVAQDNPSPTVMAQPSTLTPIETPLPTVTPTVTPLPTDTLEITAPVATPQPMVKEPTVQPTSWVSPVTLTATNSPTDTPAPSTTVVSDTTTPTPTDRPTATATVTPTATETATPTPTNTRRPPPAPIVPAVRSIALLGPTWKATIPFFEKDVTLQWSSAALGAGQCYNVKLWVRDMADKVHVRTDLPSFQTSLTIGREEFRDHQLQFNEEIQWQVGVARCRSGQSIQWLSPTGEFTFEEK